MEIDLDFHPVSNAGLVLVNNLLGKVFIVCLKRETASPGSLICFPRSVYCHADLPLPSQVLVLQCRLLLWELGLSWGKCRRPGDAMTTTGSFVAGFGF